MQARARMTTKVADYSTHDVDKMSECCNSFFLVPEAMVKCSSADIEALIRPMHRGPILNYILPRLACVKYLRLLDAKWGYCNLK